MVSVSSTETERRREDLPAYPSRRREETGRAVRKHPGCCGAAGLLRGTIPDTQNAK